MIINTKHTSRDHTANQLSQTTQGAGIRYSHDAAVLAASSSDGSIEALPTYSLNKTYASVAPRKDSITWQYNILGHIHPPHIANLLFISIRHSAETERQVKIQPRYQETT